jgi:type I restriction enzyme M protein
MSNLSTFVKRIRDIMRNDAGINGDAQRIEQIAWMLFLKVYDAKENDWEMNEMMDGKQYVSIIPEPCRWRNWAYDDKSGKALTGDALLDFVNNKLFLSLKGNDVKDSNGVVLIPGVKIDEDTPIKKAIVRTTFEDANNYMKDGVLLRQVINVIDELDLSDTEESHAFGEIYESILRELQSAGSAGEFYTPRAVTDFMAKMIKPQIGEEMADFACGTGGFITSWLKELEKQVRDPGDRIALGQSIYGIEKKQFPYMLCVTNMLLHDLDVPQIYHGNSLLNKVLDYTDKDRKDVILMNPPYGGSEKAEVKNNFPADLASSETADLFMSVIMYRLKKTGRAAVILPDGFLFGTDNAKVAIKTKLFKEFNLHTIIRMPGSVFSPYTSITTNILFFDHQGPTTETWFYRLDMPDGYKHFSKTKPMLLKHFDPVIAWWEKREPITVEGFDKARKYTAKEIEDRSYNIDLCGFPHEEEEILPPKELIQQYQEKRASLNADIDRILAQISEILGITPAEDDEA